jgi:HPt (histidine-containing phosphotransfer) domain-containing protein
MCPVSGIEIGGVMGAVAIMQTSPAVRPSEAHEAGPKPVDFTYLHRFTSGDRMLEREVLYLFAQAAPAYIRQMRAAHDQKSWHAASHTLKGSARAVGAWRAARAAELAEKLTFDADADRRSLLIDTAEEAVDEAIGYVVQVFPET